MAAGVLTTTMSGDGWTIASFICAVAYPSVRAIIRKIKKITPAYKSVEHIGNDFGHGWALPSLVAMILAPVYPTLISGVDAKSLAFAGGWALLSMSVDLSKH